MSRRLNRAGRSLALMCERDRLEQMLPGFPEQVGLRDFFWELEWDPQAQQTRAVTYLPLPDGSTYTLHMDRLITNAPIGAEVVHLNGDLADCRTDNLAVKWHGQTVRLP